MRTGAYVGTEGSRPGRFASVCFSDASKASSFLARLAMTESGTRFGFVVVAPRSAVRVAASVPSTPAAASKTDRTSAWWRCSRRPAGRCVLHAGHVVAWRRCMRTRGRLMVCLTSAPGGTLLRSAVSCAPRTGARRRGSRMATPTSTVGSNVTAPGPARTKSRRQSAPDQLSAEQSATPAPVRFSSVGAGTSSRDLAQHRCLHDYPPTRQQPSDHAESHRTMSLIAEAALAAQVKRCRDREPETLRPGHVQALAGVCALGP